MGMPNRNRKLLALRVMPVLIAAAYASGAMAQEKVEEVVITAQKRSEKLQDVPLSVTAISGAQLETRGIQGSADLSSLAPTLMVTNGNSGNTTMSVISIRGSGSGSPNIFLDTAVGTYVDGVYAGKNQGGLFDILDLERVEVLRGPQGTMFGRNTLAGAINFVTRKPSGEFSGSVGVEVGDHNARVERASIDLPKMGILKLNVAARNETRDGYVTNNTGSDSGKRDKQNYRLAALLDVTPAFQVNYSYDHADVNNTPNPVSLYTAFGWKGPVSVAAAGSAANVAAIQAGASTSFPGSRNTTPGFPEYERLKTDNHALTLSYAVNPNNTVKYIYSDRTMHYADSLDLDGVAADIYSYSRDTSLKTQSHELQWVGSSGPLKYVAGYYTYKEKSRTVNPQVSTGNIWFAGDYVGAVDSKALFGQIDYDFNDKWSGSLGLRHSTDEKSVDSSQYGTGTSFGGAMTAAGLPAFIAIPGLTPVTTAAGDVMRQLAPNTYMDLSKQPGAGGTVGMVNLQHAMASKSFSSSTPAFSLSYKVDPAINVYGRVARGFRAGGFSADGGGTTLAGITAARTTAFSPEKSLTTEMGFKSTLMGGKAQLNGAIYRNTVSDLQTNQLIPGTTNSIVVNAGKAEYQGFELEGKLVVADGWRIGASWGYLDAKFKEYIDNGLNNGGALIDTASNRNPAYAPKNTVNFNIDGRLAQTAWGTLRGIMDVTYTSEMYNLAGNNDLAAANAGGANLASLCLIPSRTLVNARLLLANIPVGGPGKADLSLWARNLGDVRKVINYIDLSNYRVATWTEPRMVGLSFNYKW